MPARSALTWVIVSQKVSSIFSLDRPTTSTLDIPRVCDAPPWRPAGRRRSTILGGCRSHRAVVVAGVPQQSATLAGGDAPTIPPASRGRRGPGGARSAIPRPGPVRRAQCRCSPGRTRRLVAVKVDPFDAVVVALPAVTCTVVIAASRVRWRLDLSVPAPDGPVRQTVGDIVGGNRRRSARPGLPSINHYEIYHCGNRSTTVDIIAVQFLSLQAHERHPLMANITALGRMGEDYKWQNIRLCPPGRGALGH